MDPDRNKHPEQKGEQPLKKVINELFKSYHLDNKVNEARVVTIWEQMMGNMIASQTRYVVVRGGVLIICLKNAPLRQELFYAREKIKTMMNEELQEEFIKEVVIK